MDFLRDIWDLLRTRRKLWLLPMLIVLIVVGALVVLTEGTVLMPLLYPLF